MPGRAFSVAARALMKTAVADWWEVSIAATGTTARVRVADVRRLEVTGVGANALTTYTL